MGSDLQCSRIGLKIPIEFGLIKNRFPINCNTVEAAQCDHWKFYQLFFCDQIDPGGPTVY